MATCEKTVTLDNLFDEEVETDYHAHEYADRPKVESEPKSMMNADLLRQIKELLGCWKLEKISTDEQFQNSVGLLVHVKRVRADAEKERKEKARPFDDGKKAVQEEYVPKLEALDNLAKSLDRAGAAYQQEQRRIADEKRRIEEEKAAEERRRLAQIENDRLADEARLRDEAEAKLKAAEAAATVEEREALIAQANTAAEVADLALKEATQAAQAVTVVEAAPVADAVKVRGFSSKMKYSSNVLNVREAVKEIVASGEWGYIESAAFTKCVEGACNKLAERMGEKFKWPGCEKIETAVGRTRY